MTKQDPIEWREKSTPISSHFGDIYFDVQNGFDESRYVFLEGNFLLDRFKTETRSIHIGELGFGTGLNFFTTAKYFLELNSSARLTFSSCEKFPLSPESIRRAISSWPELSEICEEFLDSYIRMPKGFLCFEMFGGRVRVQIYFGDVLEFLTRTHGLIDAWYFDGFAPKKNPEMWRDEIFDRIGELSHQNTTFSTFSCTGFLRRKLQSLGARVEKFPGYGRKREMLKGRFESRPIRPTSDFKKIAVVGSGIAGCQVVDSFLARGHSVEVFEKSPTIAPGASGNDLALVMPFFTGENLERRQYSSAAFCFQRARYRASPQFHQTGVFQSFFPVKRGQQIKNGLASMEWPEEFIRVSEANSEFKNMDGVYIDRAGILEAKTFLRDFWSSTQAKLHLSAEIKSYSKREGKLLLTTLDDKTYEAFDHLIFCTSHEIMNIFPELSLKLRVNRGQIAEVESPISLKSAFVFGKYLSPIVNSKQIAGGTYRHDGEAAGFREEEQMEIQKDLESFFEQKIKLGKGRSSLRCRSNTHWPVVDQIEENIHICLGFGSRGFSESALAAEILASEIDESLLPTESAIRKQMMLGSIRNSKSE